MIEINTQNAGNHEERIRTEGGFEYRAYYIFVEKCVSCQQSFAKRMVVVVTFQPMGNVTK